EIVKLRQTVTALKAAYETRDVEQILVAKHAFYQVLFDGAGNPTIPAMLRTLTDRITLLRRVTLSSPERGAASVAEIDVILKAIERRDAAAAHAATLHHIGRASEMALKNLEP